MFGQNRSGAISVLVVGLGLFAGCGGGGSSGQSGSNLTVLDARAETGLGLPSTGIFINERIILSFSAPVDPNSVNEDSIQIRQITGFEIGSSVEAQGSFVVSGTTVSFVPKLPSRTNLKDAGLLPDTEYQVFCPGFPSFDSLHSIDGRALDADFSVRFTTKSTAPFLRDPVPGPPQITAIGLDLDGDGTISADGDPLTQSDEEFFDFEVLPFRIETPVGLARAPLMISFVLSEPILPSSLFGDLNQDGFPDNARLIHRATRNRIPFELELQQTFDPLRDRFAVAVILRPTTALPARSEIEVSLEEGIVDFASPARLLPSVLTSFETRTDSATLDDAFVENFDRRRDSDPSSTAEWNANDANILRAGLGIGGSGIDGNLVLPEFSIAVLDTSVNGGFFNFREIDIPGNSNLQIIGPNAPRLFCTGDINIAGTINISANDGRDGLMGQGLTRVPGAAGGPGGFRGGNANNPPYNFGGKAESGHGPTSDSGGGFGTRATFPGGGGGGGHSRLGQTCMLINIWCGIAGTAYGNSTISQLLGGSGGGGGGDTISPDPVEDVTGGSGGGGGGAISMECAGTFTMTGTIAADGGNGGDGGSSNPGGGGGGGGSGGSIKIRSFKINSITNQGASLTAQAGSGGFGGGGASSGGASGSDGRIFLASFDTNRDGQANDFFVDRLRVNVAPREIRGLISERDLGTSFGLSRWLDTGSPDPRFTFEATDPDTGFILPGPQVPDVDIPLGIPESATIKVLFQGAHEHPTLARTPDIDSATDFITRIEDLNGFQFIRYRIEFDIGPDLATAIKPEIEAINIRFQFDI